MVGLVVSVFFFVLLFLLAKGFSSFTDHNRQLDNEMRSHAIGLKLDLERRIYWSNNKIPEIPQGLHCRICGKPQTKDRKLRFRMCKECLERR